MLQRIQSVWLLLAAAFDAVTFKFPFFTGDWMKDDPETKTVYLNAQTTTLLLILSVITGVLAFVNIFLFDNRKLQLRLTYLGIFLTVGLLTLYFVEMANFKDGAVAFWVIFYFAILVSFIFAAKGIIKDEKLIKSMDRLR